MTTIKEYIELGRLPNLPEEKYKSIGEKLKIPVTDFNYDIKSTEELNRFLYNSEISRALLQQKARRISSNFIDRYEHLIEEGEKNREEAERLGYTEDAAEMGQTIDNLRTEKEEHIDTIQSFDAGRTDMLFDREMLSNSQAKKYNKASAKMENIDEKLEALYQREQQLKSTLATARTPFYQRRTKSRLEKLQKNIQNLRAKQGKLQDKQSKIVNASIEKYKQVRNAQFKEYADALARDKDYLAKRAELDSNLDSVNKDLLDNQALLEDPKLNKFQKLGHRIDNAVLNYKKSQYEKQKADLEKLRGMKDRLDKLRGKERMPSPDVVPPTREAVLA